ncbi:MAG TPA: DNA polymerase III subunit beta [Candidatus Acidoferrum sp.]|nr:DNA polymerase III subunit beta [Candidatus Acidoferrum sp.]
MQTATQTTQGTAEMEFSVKKFDLLEELELTQGVVERKTTIPILSNLLFVAKGGRLSITATDLELSIRTSCEAKVKKDGAGTIPAKKLLELVRLLPDDDDIRFKLLENHWVQVQSGRRNYKMVGMSKDNFPALPEFPHALVKIPARILADSIAKTIFAISLEESRYTLNGALLVLKPGSLTMVATDGHRLALVETDHKFEGFSSETRVLVPKKAMAEIQRLAVEAGEEATVDFGQDESHLFFQFGGRLLTARKLTGQFPNYEAVLPRDANKTVAIERDELQTALRRVSSLADARSHAIKFTLAKEGIEISASSPEYGEAKEAIEKEFKGDPVSIGFNAQYLLDFLAAAPDGPIGFELKDEQSAGQLRPLVGDSLRYRYVVMPMRI